MLLPRLTIACLALLLAIPCVPASVTPPTDWPTAIHEAVAKAHAEDATLRAAHPELFHAEPPLPPKSEGPFLSLSAAIAQLALDRTRVALSAAEGNDGAPLQVDASSWLRVRQQDLRTLHQDLVGILANLSLPADGAALEDAVWRALSIPDLELQLWFVDTGLRTLARMPPNEVTFDFVKHMLGPLEASALQAELLPPMGVEPGSPVLNSARLEALRAQVTYGRPSSHVHSTDLIEHEAKGFAGAGQTAAALVYTVYAERNYRQAVARELGVMGGVDLRPDVQDIASSWRNDPPSLMLRQADEYAARVDGLPANLTASGNNAAVMAAGAIGAYASVAMLRGEASPVESSIPTGAGPVWFAVAVTLTAVIAGAGIAVRRRAGRRS